jgi:hypothetical protein
MIPWLGFPANSDPIWRRIFRKLCVQRLDRLPSIPGVPGDHAPFHNAMPIEFFCLFFD